MPLWKVWNQVVCHGFVVCSARFSPSVLRLMRGFRNWFPVWLQQVFLRHNLNSVTNLRAQRARLLKNNCSFFRCLSRTHEIRTCLCGKFGISLFVTISWFARHDSSDRFGIIRGFRNWFPVWFQQVFLMLSHLNSFTNLRAQQARLVKNNCRFFRCLSRIHKTHMCVCGKFGISLFAPILSFDLHVLHRPVWDYSRIPKTGFWFDSHMSSWCAPLNSVMNLRA